MQYFEYYFRFIYFETNMFPYTFQWASYIMKQYQIFTKGSFLFSFGSSRGSCYSLLQYNPSSDPLSCTHHQQQQHNLDINVFIAQFYQSEKQSRVSGFPLMRQAATLAHLRHENRAGSRRLICCGGLVLAIPAPPRHQRTDLSVWISSLHTANPFYCHSTA